MTLSDPAPLGQALVIRRLVYLLAEGTLWTLRRAAGGDMAPSTALPAESVWPGLLKGLDLVSNTR